jgi:hypothetical protein
MVDSKMAGKTKQKENVAHKLGPTQTQEAIQDTAPQQRPETVNQVSVAISKIVNSGKKIFMQQTR